MSINVSEVVVSVQTLEQFDANWEKYELQNPSKAAIKKQNGEYERQRALLGGKKEEVKEETEEKVVKESKKNK